MADEPLAAAPAATPSSPLSSPSPSPSTPAASAAPAAASPSTPSSPAGTTAPAPAATAPPSRPDWLPSDDYWDAEKSQIKPELGAKFNELATRVAADDVRKGSLPQTPDAYKLELPADFKPPAGVEFKLDASNPALGQLKAVAHKHGMTQDAVNELIGVYAGSEVGSQAAIAAAHKAQVDSLGAAGPARVDAVTRFLDGMGVGDLKSGIITAKHVEAFERLITKLGNQGGAAFSAAHRVPDDNKSIPNYANMSFEQRRQAQDQQRAARARN